MPIEAHGGTREEPGWLCYCFDITKQDVLAHFARPDASYETLVDETNIATKCTACRLDLEVLLERVHLRPGATSLSGQSVQDHGRGIKVRQDLADVGFYLNTDQVMTVLRVANEGLLFDDVSRTVPYNYTVWVFSDRGKLCQKVKGKLGRREALTLSTEDLQDCPEYGWFLLDLEPTESNGLMGTVRPQMAVVGPDWTATVHTQLVSMACRYKSVLAHRTRGRFAIDISLINPNLWSAQVSLDVARLDGQVLACEEVSLPSRCAKIVSLDRLEIDRRLDGIFRVGVRSSLPVSKHVIVRHNDGSVSLDHFPNAK